MEPLVFAAALLSAALHAGWNAAVKAHPQPAEAMSAQMFGAALIGLPGLVWLGLPPLAAWPWLVLSTALNTVAVRALLQAYRTGDFGTVYPVARAVSVLAVAAVAPLAMGDALSTALTAGVVLVALALAGLAWDARRAGSRALQASTLGWTLLAGAFIGGNVLSDAQAVRLTGSALQYGFAVSLVNTLAMGGVGWVQHREAAPWTLLIRHARVAVPAAAVSSVSYMLILWAYRHAPVPQASALRDTSAFFAMLIGVVWLKERLNARRAALLGVALAGVVCLRLG